MNRAANTIQGDNVMKEELITVTREELEEYILQEALKTRWILLHIEVEELISVPSVRESKLFRDNVLLDKKEWERFLQQIEYVRTDFEHLRNVIRVMEPVYRAYHGQYELEQQENGQKPIPSDFDFDNYIKVTSTSYDADEFERMAERFEDKFTKGEIDEEVETSFR